MRATDYLNASTYPLDSDIDYCTSEEIRSLYSSGQETKIIRQYLANTTDTSFKGQFDAYNAAVESIRQAGIDAKVQAAIKRDAIDNPPAPEPEPEVTATEAPVEITAVETPPEVPAE